MKYILFCQNNYAFGILNPIKEYLENINEEYLWYINPKILKDFIYNNENHTTSINDLVTYKSDVIFVPGNEVPHYLKGLKVQIFHGLAGEKKGHFRMRHYFDLYLTQGPYFTKKFNELKTEHKNFDVIETGWPKLDIYGKDKLKYDSEKKELLKTHNAKNIVLYAPTFSPKLTSLPYLVDQIKSLAENKNYLIFFKFHPLTDEKWITIYKELANQTSNIIYVDEKNIIKYLLISDLLLSDTSSVIYEFILLDKPVISFNNISENIMWENRSDYYNVPELVEKNLTEDKFANNRKNIFENYHPYNDGNSAKRMVEAAKTYLKTNKVPNKRNISLFRKYKMYSKFGVRGFFS